MLSFSISFSLSVFKELQVIDGSTQPCMETIKKTT